jgi:hypothetical protein
MDDDRCLLFVSSAWISPRLLPLVTRSSAGTEAWNLHPRHSANFSSLNQGLTALPNSYSRLGLIFTLSWTRIKTLFYFLERLPITFVLIIIIPLMS